MPDRPNRRSAVRVEGLLWISAAESVSGEVASGGTGRLFNRNRHEITNYRSRDEQFKAEARTQASSVPIGPSARPVQAKRGHSLQVRSSYLRQQGNLPRV